MLNPDGSIIKGRLIHSNRGVEFEEGEDSKEEFLFTPGLCNSHIHSGDSVIKDPPYIPLEKLVTPPDGLKHRILETEDDEKKIISIAETIELMKCYGTTTAIEFREEGVKGVKIFLDAMERSKERVEFILLSRPSDFHESEKLLEISDGFGMSSTRDHSFRFLEELKELCRKKDRLFAIHAGEKDSDDVDLALALEPEILVHMVKSDLSQLKMAMEEEIPICVCPRSNIFTDNLPDREIADTLATYENLLIGTDNVMINSPDMFREMEIASKLFFRDDLTVLRAVFNHYTLFGREIREYLIFDMNSPNLSGTSDIISSFVRRCSADDMIGIAGKNVLLLRRKVFK